MSEGAMGEDPFRPNSATSGSIELHYNQWQTSIKYARQILPPFTCDDTSPPLHPYQSVAHNVLPSCPHSHVLQIPETEGLEEAVEKVAMAATPSSPTHIISVIDTIRLPNHAQMLIYQ